MRGADVHRAVLRFNTQETSPHAWSKQKFGITDTSTGRNISTCVEQTFAMVAELRPAWKHLHMRGANPTSWPYDTLPAETSPHAWSKRRCWSA